MPLKLAGLLVTSGMVPSQLIDDALRRQVLAGDSIDTALLELGPSFTEELCLSALEQASGVPSAGTRQLAGADPAALELVPGKLAERHCLLPLRLVGRGLQVAVAYPVDVQMLEEIGFLLGRELHPVVAIEARLREAISNAYDVSLPARHAALVAILGPVPFERRKAEKAAKPEAATVAEPPPSQPPEPPAPSPLPSEDSAAQAKPAEAAPSAEPAPSPASAFEPRPPATADPLDFSADDLAAPAAVEPKKREPAVFEPAQPEGLASAIEQVLAAAENDPKLLEQSAPPPSRPPTGPAAPRRNAPRDRVDVAGIARRIVAAAGGQGEPEPLDAKSWTLGKAKSELEKARDRHQIISVTLRFALKTFDFAAAFAVVGGNAVGWTALTVEGKADEKVEKISLPLDAPSVLRTVLMARGSYLGPISKDALSQSLLSDMGRNPSIAFFYPVEVRDRPVVILYGDVVGRPASDRRVAELVLFAQGLGPRFERLILDQKLRLASEARAEQQPPDAEAGLAMRPPALTTAELFARSPLRKRKQSDRALDPPMPRPTVVSPAPGVSRVAAARASDFGTSLLPSMDELFGAADRLVSTDLSARARALGELCRFPEVAAAVLVARFPGPVLRARAPVTELPSPEELGPIPAALVHMGAAAGRALAPLLESRDLDTRYFALLTAARMMSPMLLQPIASRALDRHPVIASAARAALAGMQSLSGFEAALQTVREALGARESDTVMAAARALGQLHDTGAIERLIELTGSPHKLVGQVAVEALRETCLQTYGQSPGRWRVWWRSHREETRIEWLVEGLGHRDPAIRLMAIDELMHEVGDSFGYEAESPKPVREKAIGRWKEWATTRPGRQRVG
jgi:hypothetical protein